MRKIEGMIKLIASALMLAVAASSGANAMQIDYESVPPELRSAYDSDRQRIEALGNEVADASRPATDRAAALEQLSLQYPYVVLGVARAVALDPAPEVARAATQIVANSVVMMNHSMNASDDKQMQMQTSNSEKVLLEVIKSGEAGAQKIAAATTATLGMRDALDAIAGLNKSGKVSDADAVKYFTLTSSGVGAPYVLPFLSSKNTNAQQQAIAYLGPLPQYQAQIRQGFLLDPLKPSPLRAEAARVLARTDPTFQTYAIAVVKTPGTSIDILDAIIKGSLENNANPVNSQQLGKYRLLMQDYLTTNPLTDTKRLEDIGNQIKILE